MNQRTTEWCIDRDLLEREECEGACHAVLDVVLPRVQRAWIDAYSDEQHPPAEASAASKCSSRWDGPGQREIPAWASTWMFATLPTL